MSSNIQLINPTEDKIQDDIGNLQTNKQKASYSYSEKPLIKDNDNYLHWINQGLLQKMKQKTY